MPKHTTSNPLSILVVNGPNLNLLGKREPEIYGTETLENIMARLHILAKEHRITLNDFQSNHEGECVERIQATLDDGSDCIILNPGAFTHTSIAIRDALAAVKKPFIEVHLSNIYAREAFRKHSYLCDIAMGVISGLGAKGYELALLGVLHHYKQGGLHGHS